MDAVVTAGGRVTGPLAEQTGQDIKCLIELDGRRLIDRVLDALHQAESVSRVTVVGPPEIKAGLDLTPDDRFCDEADSGPANFLLGLRAVGEVERVVFCTSDVPFVTGPAIDGLVSRCPEGYGVHYPIFTRQEIQARFPLEAGNYMPLADGDLSGSSAMVIEPARVLDREADIRALFEARKDFLRLAKMVGLSVGLRFLVTKKLGWRILSVDQMVKRIEKLAGFPVRVVRGCDPAISFDIDHERDWAEALAHVAAGVGGA